MKNKLIILISNILFVAFVNAEPKQLDKIIAIVNDDIIMQSELNNKLKQVQANIQKQNAQLPNVSQLSKQVLDNLILESIQLQKGMRYGIRINDDELNNAIDNIAANNNLTVANLYKNVISDGLSVDDFRTNITNELIINKVRQYEVSERINISEQEVNNFLHENQQVFNLNEEYSLANILIAVNSDAHSDVVNAAYAKAVDVYQRAKQGADFAKLALINSTANNALQGGNIGWRKLIDMPSPFDSWLSSAKIGDVLEPVRTPNGFIIIKLQDKRRITNTAHEYKVRHILIKPNELRSDIESRRLLEGLYNRINQGADFAELARQFSEDYASALEGGNLDWVDANSLVPEFRQVMLTSKINVLSKPFKSVFGWHILQVLDKRDIDVSEQMRKNQAQRILYNRKYEYELQSWLNNLREEAYIEINI